MHINELIKLKLKDELYHELLNFYSQNKFMNKTLFKKLIIKKINLKLNNINILESRTFQIKEENRCCARIWDNHLGTRCYYKKNKNTDYCSHHLNVLNKNGKLRFNRYDEDKPLFNEKNNKIPWVTKNRIDILNDIVSRQWSIINKKILKDLKKQRQIAP